MTRQAPWSLVEAVILLDATLQYKAGIITRKEAVHTVSVQLRQMAQVNGQEIDDIYRNLNGIDFQMASMESALAGHTIRKRASRLFEQVVSLYNTNPAEYHRILSEAIAMKNALSKATVEGKRDLAPKTDASLTERTRDLLKAICAVNANGVTLKSLAKCLKEPETTIEKIISQAAWADSRSGKYLFNDKASKKTDQGAIQNKSLNNGRKTNIGNSAAEKVAEARAIPNKPEDSRKKDVKTINRMGLDVDKEKRQISSQGIETLERRIYKLVKAGCDGRYGWETVQTISQKLKVPESEIGAVVLRAKWISYRSGRLSIIGEFSENTMQLDNTNNPHQTAAKGCQQSKNETKQNCKTNKIAVPNSQKANKQTATNDNNQMISDCTYSSIYGLSTSDYERVDITTLPLSVRSINCFKQNHIDTLADLLNTTPSKLLTMRNLGKKTLAEIEKYLSAVSNGDNELFRDAIVATSSNSHYCDAGDQSNQNRAHLFSPFICNHAEDIIYGDFSFAEQSSLSDDELNAINAYKEAYAALDGELVLECFNQPERVRSIRDAFSEYNSTNALSFEIAQLLEYIPIQRRNRKAKGFIEAFTTIAEEQSTLNDLYETDARLCDVNIEKLSGMPAHVFNLLRHFFSWCLFDLEKEIADLYSAVCKNARIKAVIKGRAEKKTLDEIGAMYGITRERIRQIEVKAKRAFSCLYGKTRFMLKISAELDGSTVIFPSAIAHFCKNIAIEVIFLLKGTQSAAFTYDPELDVFIIGDDSIKSRLNTLIENLPDIIKEQRIAEIIAEAKETDDIPEEMMQRALLDAYRVTGGVYHKTRLSLGTIYELVIEKYYPKGIMAYDPYQLREFRRHIQEDYGDVGLPENDRALTGRIAGICILCGKGKYTVKKKKYIPEELKNRIYQYIINSKNTIFLTNTLFSVFEDDLAAAGIDNKYYLQGVLHELFGDEFYFKRDYVSKDRNMTSMYAEIEEYIHSSNYPVSKQQIQREFPGVSEIVIMLTVSGPNILNYFGQYLHADKLRLTKNEIEGLRSHLKHILRDNNAHGSGEVFEELSYYYNDLFKSNGVFYPFSAFSLLEYLFRDKFQFSRPYIALRGVEIGRPAERLHEYVYTSDEIAVSDLFDYVRGNKIYVQSMLEFINSCNDQFVFSDEDNILRTELTGANKDIAAQVESLVLSEINSTVPIRDLKIWQELPTISVPWTDWLVYSILKKWGKRVEVSTSSGQLRFAVPLVSPLGKMMANQYKDLKKDHGATYQCDNLDDIDSLIVDMIDDDLVEGL